MVTPPNHKDGDHKDGQEKPQDEKRANANLAMKACFDRYNSPFMQLMMPLLTTRYVWLAIEDINPLNFLKKPHPTSRPGFTPWVNPDALGYVRRNFAAIGMGATTLGVMAYYSKRTYDDIKTLYSESVGYELRKKPEDVTLGDIFLRSRNSALDVTRNAFINRTFARLVTGSAFLMPWHKFRDWKIDKPKYDANANAGVGAVALYLSLEGFMRSPSFFDAEQKLVDTAINHSGSHSHQIIETMHIQSLLMLQRKHLDKKYKWPEFNSWEGQNEAVLAGRIAALMNQTYNNVADTEPAHFTIGKFNYLIGFGLLDRFPTSLAFVELANKSSDMESVNAVADAIRSGQDPKAVFASHGIDMDRLATPQAPAAPVQGQAETRFADSVKPREKAPQAARTHQEFALRVDESPSQHLN
jgi:hypothetical protein